MDLDRRPSDARLAQIRELVKTTRQEMAWLSPADHELRHAICCDLVDLLKELRAVCPALVGER